MTFNEDQVQGINFHARKLDEATRSLHALDEIHDSAADVEFMRGYHQRDIRKHLLDLAKAAGGEFIGIPK